MRELERKDATSLANPDPILLSLFGLGPDGLISRQEAMDIPAVNAAIRGISEAAATLDINVVRLDANGTETPDNEHPVAALLRDQVNDWTDTPTLIRDLTIQALTSDKGGLAWVNRVDGRPAEIIQYRESVIAVAYDTATNEPTYSIDSSLVDAADIIHVRAPFNRCPLTMAMRAATIAYHLENHALNLFKTGARPGGIVRFKKGLGDEGLKKMKAGWRAAFEGSDNAGRTAILWDDAEFQPLSFNSTDSQFTENRQFQVLELCRAFRIPPQMVYDLGRATWSNGEQQGREFLSYTLEPWLASIEGALRRALFSPEERKQYRIRFDRDDLTRASLTERAVAINSLRASGVINADEGRDWLEMAPRTDEGGTTFENPNITAKPAVTPLPKPRVVA